MNRIVILGTLLLVLSLSLNYVIDREDGEVSGEERRNDPDLYMLNASIKQFDENGALQRTLSAGRFTHFPLTDLTTLQAPSIVLAIGAPSTEEVVSDDSKSERWEISAKAGRLIPATPYRDEIVELWDNVLAARVSGDEFINIQTSSLTVYPDREYVETDQKVFIDNQSGRTTAAGMKAYLDSNRFMFFSKPDDRVTTIFLPE